MSKMMRDNKMVEASLMAFKLNKLRDFFHAMDRLVSGRLPPPKPFIRGINIPGVDTNQQIDRTQDPVESILINQEHFESVLETG